MFLLARIRGTTAWEHTYPIPCARYYQLYAVYNTTCSLTVIRGTPPDQYSCTVHILCINPNAQITTSMKWIQIWRIIHTEHQHFILGYTWISLDIQVIMYTHNSLTSSSVVNVHMLLSSVKTLMPMAESVSKLSLVSDGWNTGPLSSATGL